MRIKYYGHNRPREAEREREGAGQKEEKNDNSSRSLFFLLPRTELKEDELTVLYVDGRRMAGSTQRRS